MSRHGIARRNLLGAAGFSALSAAQPQAAIPTVPLGKHRVTRLIVGSNPITGISHSTRRMSDLMSQYFTVERTTDFLLSCELRGINTFQSSYWPKVRDAIRGARERGSKLHFICLTSGRQLDVLDDVVALKPIAIVHHGGVTDSLFRAGKHGDVRDYLKHVHDLGLLAGMSTHRPENLAHAEDAGFEADFYMACFYQVSRTPEEVARLTGGKVLDELYLASDRDLMTSRVREVKKTCLGFKILAAGRLCNSPAMV
ncbi:MAG TPA: hypothetical protein VN442_25710, partial [Bryobacteraceae bacterium]|nr:hypothetical protein [Bryobacteraceae bacterium]